MDKNFSIKLISLATKPEVARIYGESLHPLAAKLPHRLLPATGISALLTSDCKDSNHLITPVQVRPQIRWPASRHLHMIPGLLASVEMRLLLAARENAMHLSGPGRELIRRVEGFRSRTYTDLAGRETIGFGHMLLPAESYVEGVNVAQAEAILAADVGEAEKAVSRLVKVPLAQGQFDALVDFVFNLGSGRLATSTLLKDLNAGKYDSAAWQLLVWDHVGTQEVAGLKARREAEFHLWSDAVLQHASAA